MKLKVYGYGGCSTCRKAEKWLKGKGLAVESIDITETAPSLKELQAMLAVYDGQLKKLFNTSGVVYREQKISEKLPGLAEGEALKLLAGNGRLVKRPFLVVDGKPRAVGFDEKAWAKLLG